MKRVGIQISGGLGKNICFSACIPKLKEKFEELVLVSAYPEVYACNTDVWRNLKFEHPYLFEDYLHSATVYKEEPYLTDEYRFENKHIIEAYCKVLNLEYTPDMKPQIILNEYEESEAEKFRQSGDYILIHRQGGTTYYNPQQALHKITKSRDWPIELAQEFVNEFKKKYPRIKIVQIGLQTEPMLKDVLMINNLPSRMLFPLMKYCKSFVVIDSFFNHTSAAFDKRGVVLFGGTEPKRLGYKRNTNMTLETDCTTPFCHKSDYYGHLGGKEWSCPAKYKCMEFKPNEVLASISSILDEDK